MGREDAIREAASDCVKRNVLKRFLENNGGEVMSMLLTEWNWDDALRVQKEEGRQEGRQEERRKLLELLEQGITLSEVKKKLGLDSVKL
ncbi:MAG: hypothetical protein LBH98_04195 [Chitinispirillales bacterium]|jgi:predicted transposase YdaD|nr:hypothetical protein [Chitinispirillales bacterium]